MYKTKDGTNYGSNARGRAHDAAHSGGEKESAAPKAMGGSDHEEPDGDETPMHEVVAEHGTANKTEIEGDGDQFHVTSHHEDGHKHKSKGHKSAQAAHMHSMHAMTGQEPDAMGEEEPEASPAPMHAGAGIPGM